MQRTLLLTSFFLIFYSGILFSQTHVIPKFGINYSGINFEPINFISYKVDSKFTKSLIWGASIHQELNQIFNLSLDLVFSKRMHNSYSTGSVPKHKFKYRSFRSVVTFNWRPINQLFLGLGTSFNYINKIKIFNADGFESKRSLEAAFSLNYFYKKMNFGVSYYQLLLQGKQEIPIYKIPNTISAYLGYRFQLIK